MKRILSFGLGLLAILPAIANAALPLEGKYNCGAGRSFTNTTVSTKDNLVLQFWLSKAGNPVVKITTQDPAVSRDPSVFGGAETQILQPIKPEACKSRSHSYQIQDCSVADLPALNQNQNLFVTPGVQYVEGVKISGSFNLDNVVGAQYDNLAIIVKFRKNKSHWERIYGCKLVK